MDGQHRQGQHEHDRVDEGLPSPAKPDREPVRISIPGQQHDLEEENGRCPHRGGAAKHRQNHLADHRLDEEKQERAGEDAKREDCDHSYGGRESPVQGGSGRADQGRIFCGTVFTIQPAHKARRPRSRNQVNKRKRVAIDKHRKKKRKLKARAQQPAR